VLIYALPWHLSIHPLLVSLGLEVQYRVHKACENNDAYQLEDTGHNSLFLFSIKKGYAASDQKATQTFFQISFVEIL
jgi:hypothetical protein